MDHAGCCTVRDGALRGNRRGTAQWNPTRLDFQDVFFDDFHTHPLHATIQSPFEFIERHLYARDEARLLDEHHILVHG